MFKSIEFEAQDIKEADRIAQEFISNASIERVVVEAGEEE